MADARQIVFSNFISPQIGTTIAATTQSLEEYTVGDVSYVKWKIDTGVNKSLGGKGIVNSKTFSQVEKWAKMQGATKSAAWAQEAQARLYKNKAGFTTMRYVMEKKL